MQQSSSKGSQESSHTNNLSSHLKELVKEQTKPKVRRRKGMIKIRSERNET